MATGTISKALRYYLSSVPGSTKSTTEHTHIVHCTHTTGSANVKVQNMFNVRNNMTCSKQCKYRTTATLYTLQTWFVSGT